MDSHDNINPPTWLFNILKRLINQDYLEEVEGDMEEVFQDNLEKFSRRKANRLFLYDSIALLRPGLIKPIPFAINTNFMIRNHLKIALRIFKKEKSYTTINIVGLSTAFAIALLIIQYARFELSYEDYNPDADKVVRVTTDYMNGETVVEQDVETFPPLGELLATEFPEVEAFTRAYHLDDHVFKVGEDVFREPRMYGVDPSFFDVMHYQLIHGDENLIFQKPHEIVLTQSSAYKYFNRSDVVGEKLFWPSLNKEFVVVGVVNDSPPNTHLKFDVLMSYPTLLSEFKETEDNWSGNNTLLYVKLADAQHYLSFQSKLDELSDRLIAEEKFHKLRATSERIADIHLYSTKSFEPEKPGNATSVYFLLGVALLIIALAVVNYINLSTSKSLDRAKEVGIRKVVGSSMTQLRLQFFTESFLINMIAALIAAFLILFYKPEFTSLAGLPQSLPIFNDISFWQIFGFITLTCIFLSGIFPAIILSSIKPITALKGKFSQSSSGALLRKGLVVSQFAITLFLLIQTLTANQQLQFMRDKDLGLNAEHTVVVNLPHGDHSDFKQKLVKYNEIRSAAFSNMVPGQSSSYMGTSTGIRPVDDRSENNFNFYFIWIGHDYIPTMEMELLAGNNFKEGVPDYTKMIVNEEAIRLWGYPNAEAAVGQKISYWGRQAEIIGVVKNFHVASAKSPHIPMLFLQEDDDYTFLSIRTTEGNMQERVRLIEDEYKAYFSDSPFEYFFLDQEFDKQYKAEQQFRQVFALLTSFAILIACLGLYGLASFMISKRKKEIGVRKVLGARISQLILLLSKDYLILVSLAVVFTLPISYFILTQWLEQFAYRIELDIWIFIVPAVLLLVVSFLTVFGKTFKISNINPADSLRSE